MRAGWICLLMIGASCSKGDDPTGEKAYVESEIASLQKALADGDETHALVDCMSLRSSLKRMKGGATASTIERLCDVELPRLILRNAVADVAKKNAEHPELAEMNCFQLLAKDAFEASARRPGADAEVEKLKAEYVRLCPAQAAKLPR